MVHLLATFVLVSSFLSTDLPPIATDRPGFSDTFLLVPKGRAHLEWGYSFTHDHERQLRTDAHTVGEWSLRVGCLDWLELRAKWTGMLFTETIINGEKEHDDGASDMSIGFKLPVLKQNGFIPNVSLTPAVSIPAGSNNKSTGDVDPEMRVAWNYAITPKWSIYGIGSVASITDSDGRFFQAGASLATAYQITDRLSWFTEYYGLYPSTRNTDCQHNVNFGPVILVNDNFQIDMRVGFGLNEEAPDFIAGIGFGLRF